MSNSTLMCTSWCRSGSRNRAPSGPSGDRQRGPGVQCDYLRQSSSGTWNWGRLEDERNWARECGGRALWGSRARLGQMSRDRHGNLRCSTKNAGQLGVSVTGRALERAYGFLVRGALSRGEWSSPPTNGSGPSGNAEPCPWVPAGPARSVIGLAGICVEPEPVELGDARAPSRAKDEAELGIRAALMRHEGEGRRATRTVVLAVVNGLVAWLSRVSRCTVASGGSVDRAHILCRRPYSRPDLPLIEPAVDYLDAGPVLLVVGAALLAIVAGLSDHLDVEEFWSAVLGGFLIGVFSWLAEMLLPARRSGPVPTS